MNTNGKELREKQDYNLFLDRLRWVLLSDQISESPELRPLNARRRRSWFDDAIFRKVLALWQGDIVQEIQGGDRIAYISKQVGLAEWQVRLRINLATKV